MPRWLNVLIDGVFPLHCAACERLVPHGHGSSLCAPCRAAMAPPPEPLCRTCGVPLPPSDPSGPCPGCLRHPPAFSTARAAALYLPSASGLNPLAAAVQGLKYRGRRALADALGALLAERYPFADDALLVPVPLHRDRLRERGFDQALLLAQALGRRRGLPVAPRLLVRVRATETQARLQAHDRWHNLRGAFAACAAGVPRARPLVLVDDVLTTGATANACAAALRAAGAVRVDVFTVGRAP
jgi:ComF family protein